MLRGVSEPARGYSSADMMTCVMARLIHDGDTVFHGVSSPMPMAAVLLAKEMHAPHAVHLNIPGGVNPQEPVIKDYTSAGPELIRNSEAIFPLSEVFDLSMRGGLDIAFLSGVQFDVNGNVNASVIGEYDRPKVRLPGGAGSAVLIPTVKRAILWRTKHDTRTFVKQVDFTTTRGNIDRIVTPLCVFKFDRTLKLESIHPGVSFKDVAQNTGFEIEDPGIETPPPTMQEIRILNGIDPENYRSIEFRK